MSGIYRRTTCGPRGSESAGPLFNPPPKPICPKHLLLPQVDTDPTLLLSVWSPDKMRIRRPTVERPFATLNAWTGSRSKEMSVHVLAYDLERVTRILGIAPLMQAMCDRRRVRRRRTSIEELAETLDVDRTSGYLRNTFADAALPAECSRLERHTNVPISPPCRHHSVFTWPRTWSPQAFENLAPSGFFVLHRSTHALPCSTNVSATLSRR